MVGDLTKPNGLSWEDLTEKEKQQSLKRTNGAVTEQAGTNVGDSGKKRLKCDPSPPIDSIPWHLSPEKLIASSREFSFEKTVRCSLSQHSFAERGLRTDVGCLDIDPHGVEFQSL